MKIARNQTFMNFDPPAEWKTDPALYVIHKLLDERSNIFRLAVPCFPNAVEEGKGFMGYDGMTVEQVVRAAIYKQYRRLNFRELAEHTADSFKGRKFMKIDYKQHFSHQTLHENIARLSPEALTDIQRAVTKVGMELGIDDGQKIRSDATSIETDVHHPTEASSLWDCIRVACRLLETLTATGYGFTLRDYRKGAKKLLFKINNCKNNKAKRKKLFKQLLKTNQACLNQVDAALDLAARLNLPMLKQLFELCQLRPMMAKTQEMTRRHQLNDEKVAVKDKIFSIFEDHTDCISKGARKVIFGHKVNFASGKRLVFDCLQALGNWSEKVAYGPILERIKDAYDFVPRDLVTDGGPAYSGNLKKAIELGVKNVVFGKTTGSMQNQVSSKAMETRLKKWRSGIEAGISNFKRGLRAVRCPWKGWNGFQRFMLLNVTVFNLKVIAADLLSQL